MKLTAEFEKDLDREIAKRFDSGRLPRAFLEALGARGARAGALAMSPAASSAFGQLAEAIVLAHNRPSLLVQDDGFEAPVSTTWSVLLKKHRATLEKVLPAIGRIELEHHPQLSWAGTGFLVAPDVIVTNRHVAQEFVEQQEQGFVWRRFSNLQVDSGINYGAEHERSLPPVALTEILHVEDEDGPDMAFFRIEAADAERPRLELATGVAEDDLVATVGHPGREHGLAPEVEKAMDRIFRGIFNVKRLAPGKIMGVQPGHVKHDCSTLRGNSGSAVVDVETGRAVALHYRGGFAANFAVPATVIDARLQQL